MYIKIKLNAKFHEIFTINYSDKAARKCALYANICTLINIFKISHIRTSLIVKMHIKQETNNFENAENFFINIGVNKYYTFTTTSSFKKGYFYFKMRN